MNRMEGHRDPGLHRQHLALSAAGRLLPNSATSGAEQSQDQHPQQHRAFVVSPCAGELVEQRHLRMGILEDVEDREIRRDVACYQRREGDRDEAELRNAAGRRPPSARHRGYGPRSPAPSIGPAPMPARERERNDRSLRSSTRPHQRAISGSRRRNARRLIRFLLPFVHGEGSFSSPFFRRRRVRSLFSPFQGK